MKNNQNILTAIVAIFLIGSVITLAGGKHEKAPHNGRLMETKKIGFMHIEFLVGSDKTVSVYLYDAKLKAVAPSDQTLSLIVQGKEDAKNQVDLVKKEDRFISPSPLTIPEDAKAVLTIKAGGKTENLRFAINLAVCGECKNAEYACSCGH